MKTTLKASALKNYIVRNNTKSFPNVSLWCFSSFWVHNCRLKICVCDVWLRKKSRSLLKLKKQWKIQHNIYGSSWCWSYWKEYITVLRRNYIDVSSCCGTRATCALTTRHIFISCNIYLPLLHRFMLLLFFNFILPTKKKEGEKNVNETKSEIFHRFFFLLELHEKFYKPRLFHLQTRRDEMRLVETTKDFTVLRWSNSIQESRNPSYLLGSHLSEMQHNFFFVCFPFPPTFLSKIYFLFLCFHANKEVKMQRDSTLSFLLLHRTTWTFIKVRQRISLSSLDFRLREWKSKILFSVTLFSAI